MSLKDLLQERLHYLLREPFEERHLDQLSEISTQHEDGEEHVCVNLRLFVVFGQ